MAATTSTESAQVSFDLPFLAVYDSTAFAWAGDGARDEQIQKRATRNVTALLNRLLAIKTERDALRELKPDELQIHDFERTPYDVDLPPVSEVQVRLPRQRKIPNKEEHLTRWEKFAREKGIKKNKKRSRMVFDEVTQDWVPRWGAYSIKKRNPGDPILEVKDGDDPYEDPFKRRGLEKSLQREKQKFNELRNRLEAKGYDAKEVLNQTQGRRLQKSKQKASKALTVAQNSTASMGNFDKKAHAAEHKVHNKKVKKRKQLPGSSNAEKQRDHDILDLVVGQNQGAKKLKKE